MDDIFDSLPNMLDDNDVPKQNTEQPDINVQKTAPVNNPVASADNRPNQYAQPQQPSYAANQSAPQNRYTSPAQNSYQYYQPPRQNVGNTMAPPYAPPLKPKKKKNKALTIIVVIIVVCVILSVGAIFVLSNVYKNDISMDNDSQSTTSQHEDGGVAVEVESSDETAKKDKKGDYTTAGVVSEVIDSCVGITVYSNQSNYSYFYGYAPELDSEPQKSGEGSGVIMAENNGKTYIITCAHVIVNGSKFTVTLNDDTELDAQMVGCDEQSDIGVLVVEKTGLQVAHFGDSKDIELGEPCVAIGCPGGLEFKNSVTQGIVSALARPIQSQIGYDNECIQVDAAINPGNSGGALFNMQGQVIGINSSKIASTEYEGMGFAVPSSTAIKIANSLIKDGYVAGRAKLGIEYMPIQNYANYSDVLSDLAKKGYKDADGVMVIETINDDSDLKNKDIQQKDMIVAVNGKTLTSSDVMTSVLSDSKPGDTVTLVIARKTGSSIKTFEVKCKLIESKD